MADLGNLELKVIVDTASLSEAADKSDKARAAAEELQGAYDKTTKKSASARAATLKYNQTLSQLDDQFRRGEMSLGKYRRSVALLSARFDTITKDVGVAGKTFGRFGSQIQNAGFQVGDFATQVASGQSAVVALAQQLPQLLGGLGVFGALAGAATAIGGALFLYARDAEEAAGATSDYKTEVQLLREELLGLAQARRQAAASDPVNLLGNIEDQRRQLSTFINEINQTLTSGGGIERVFAGPSAQSNQFRAANLESLREIAGVIERITGEEIELNDTYSGRQGVLEALTELQRNALEAVRELSLNEQDVSDTVDEQNKSQREAQELAEQRLAALNNQLGAIDQGTSALDAQQALQRQALIDQMTAKGVAEETATALVDQEAALSGAVQSEKEASQLAEKRKRAAEQTAEAERRRAASEAARVEAANAGAEMQLMALQAEQQALQQGKSARDAAFVAQQALTAEQLRGKGVAEDTVQEILRLRDELRNAGDDAGDDFAKGFESAGAQIAGSVTDALISGDWEGTGQQVGSVMGAAIAAAISAGNPIAMAVGGAVGGALFGGDSGGSRRITGNEVRSGQLTGEIFGSIDERTGEISEYTAETASALDELIGVNRELLAAQVGADKAIDRFGARVVTAVENQGNAITKAAGVGIAGTLESPELQGLFTRLDLSKPLEGPEIDRLRSLLTEATDATSDVIVSAFSALGLDAQEALTKPFDTGLLSLKDLDADQASEEFSRLFGSIINQVAAQTSPELQEFVDQFGESAGSVLQDFARNATVATGSLSGLNSSLDQLTGLELGQVATDLVEVFGDGSALAAAASGIFSTFASEEQQSAENLARLNAEFDKLGLALPESRQGVLELVASLDLRNEKDRETLEAIDRSTDSLDDYFGTLEDGAEEAAQAAEDAFAGLRSATDSALADLKRSIDAQSDAVKDELNNTLSELKAQESAEKDRHRSAMDSIKSIYDEQKELIKSQEDAALAANRAQVDAAKDRVSLIKDELSDITSAFENLRGNVSSLVEFDRRAALQTLRNAVSTGNLTGTGAAAEAASQINETRFRSAVDLRREQVRTVNLLDELKGDGESQLTTSELQLEVAENQTAVIKQKFDSLEESARRVYEAEKEEEDERSEQRLSELREIKDDAKSAADAQLDQLRATFERESAAVDAMRGIDNSVLSVRNAIEDMSAAVIAELSGLDVGGGSGSSGGTGGPTLGDVNQLFVDLLGREIGAEGRAYFGERLAAGDSLADIAYIIRNSPEYQNQIPGFANGGMHSGGLRIVGEVGPELEMTGPSRIIPHNAIMGAISGTGVASELKPILETAVALLQNINTHSRESNNQLSRWNGQGLPKTRNF